MLAVKTLLCFFHPCQVVANLGENSKFFISLLSHSNKKGGGLYFSK
jgi:hypothetical protein